MSHPAVPPHENFNVPNPEIGTDSLQAHCTVLTCSLRLSRQLPAPDGAESTIVRRIQFR